VVRHWCDVSGIPYLGRADIGHDIDNKIVPFGRWSKSGSTINSLSRIAGEGGASGARAG
jgi:hypothetical protein